MYSEPRDEVGHSFGRVTFLVPLVLNVIVFHITANVELQNKP